MNANSEIVKIFKAHSKDLIGVCYYILKDKEASKDIMMDTFEIALKHDDFTQIQNPRAWLMRVAKNLSLKRFHKQIKNTYMDEIKNLPKIFMESIAFDEQVYNEIIEHQLIEELGMLKPMQSKCIELFFLSKYSYAEIGDELGIEIKSVKSYIQNGKRNLRQKLESKRNTDIL